MSRCSRRILADEESDRPIRNVDAGGLSHLPRLHHQASGDGEGRHEPVAENIRRWLCMRLSSIASNEML
jgi:hypothetical protein